MMDTGSYLKQLRENALSSGFNISSYGTLGALELLVLEKAISPRMPEVYLSAGVHGNEPAGPLAILEMLADDTFPDSVNLTIFPLVNPHGLEAGTRENLEGIDLNRDYGRHPQSHETRAHAARLEGRTFDLAICLHEDDDGEGFYIYSHVTVETKQDFPGLAIEAAKPFTGIDQRRIIDQMPARNGRMYPPASVIDSFGENLPEALRLKTYHGARYTFTTETPSGQAMENRIRAQKAAVTAILTGYLSEM